MFLGQGIVAVVGYASGLLLNNLAKIACILLIFIVIGCVAATYFCGLLVDCLGDKVADPAEGRKDSRFRRKTTSVFYASPEDIRRRRGTSTMSMGY